MKATNAAASSLRDHAEEKGVHGCEYGRGRRPCDGPIQSRAAPARAESIPWYYSWLRTPDVIYADNSTASTVALSPASQVEQTPTSSVIEAANVFHYGDGANGPPAEFSGGPSDQFTLTLTIHDPSVANPGSVTFTGEILGYLTPTDSHIQTFYTGATTKSLTLGKHLYTIQSEYLRPVRRGLHDGPGDGHRHGDGAGHARATHGRTGRFGPAAHGTFLVAAAPQLIP